jgi:hypothetical protein
MPLLCRGRAVRPARGLRSAEGGGYGARGGGSLAPGGLQYPHSAPRSREASTVPPPLTAVLRIPDIFGVDPDPRIHASDKLIRIRIRMRIRILLFSSLTFKTPKKTFLKSFSSCYFLKLLLHHFSRVKSKKDVTTQ